MDERLRAGVSLHGHSLNLYTVVVGIDAQSKFGQPVLGLQDKQLVCGIQIDHRRKQQLLRSRGVDISFQLTDQVLVQNALVRTVLVNEQQP